MYYAHFGLKEPPFKITPNTDFFFPGGNRGAVLDALIYAIKNGEGIIKVVGEVGSGKTMLCRMLQVLLPQNIETVYLANPSMAPDDVLQAIAFELQLKLPKQAEKFQVMQMLQQSLLEKHAAGRQVVVFVEEAQGMPLSTLEEIRLLSNLETKHDKLLQIVLFGQPELDANLNAPQIRQLRERITHSFYLGPLREADVGEYLMFRLRSAGYFGPPLFNKAAIRYIAKTAKGLVRRINILADKALLAAFSENLYQITPRQVRAAIRDSEFNAELPAGSVAVRPVYYMAAATLLAGIALGFSLNALTMRPEQAHVQAAADTKSAATTPAGAAEPAVLPAKAEALAQPIQKVNLSNLPQDILTQDILTQRLLATEAWLHENPETTVSLQLMGSASDDQVRSELQALASTLDPASLYVFRTKVGATPFITVLYGSYPSRSEAALAMRDLPAAVQSNRPQMRTVGGVMKEIKQFQ